MLKKRYWLKLLVNIAIIALEILTIYSAYALFAHKWEPVRSVLTLLGIITLLYFSWKAGNQRWSRWQRPGLMKTTSVVLAIAVICTFAGIEPMSTFKDNLFTSWEARQTEWKEAAEKAQQEKEIKETQEQAEKEATAQIEQQSSVKELEKEVVLLVNLIRTDRGSAMLIWDNQLYEYSKSHSENMASKGEMFHSNMNLPYGENAWQGTGTAWDGWDIVESWLGSDAHRTWLLCPHLKHIAVGIAISNNGDMYASWTFWRNETRESDWWYANGTPPPDWWHLE